MFVPRLWSPEDGETHRTDAPPGPPSSTSTVQQVVDFYLANHKPGCGEWAKETRRLLGLFCHCNGERAIATAKPLLLQLWIDSQAGMRSAWTRKRAISTIKRPFNWCRKLGLIERNPFEAISGRQGRRGRDLTDAEFRSLLRAAPVHFRRVLVWLRWSGMRPVEMRRLEWAQVREELSAILQEEHKTADAGDESLPRKIVLNRCMVKLLAWLRRRGAKGRWVFLNSRGGQWQRAALCKMLRHVRRKAGLPKACKLYGCRHSFGTGAILNGVDPITLAELMGHRRLETTYYYVHLAGKTDHLKAAAELAGRTARPVL